MALVFTVFMLAIALTTELHGQAQAVGLAYQFTHKVNADPSLSPDGKRMVYISVVNGREQLVARNLDGSDPVQ